jgi:phosphopantetheinyl transferase (holo-ACP synthase)
MVVNINIPQTWNELTNKQFKNIVYQLECYYTIVKDTPAALNVATNKLYLQICKELLKNNNWKSQRWALKEIQPKAFQDYLKFIYAGVQRTKFIPSIKINNTTYYAPDMRLRNSTIAEFAYADSAYYKWRQTQQHIWLDVLCAAMYREANPKPNDVDIRKPFIKQAVDVRADAFTTLNYQTKLAIAYTYEGCRNHIADSFPLIFPKPIKVDGETPSPKKQRYISFGEIIIDKIEGDPSKLHITNNVMLYDFLSIYNQDLKNLRKKKAS